MFTALLVSNFNALFLNGWKKFVNYHYMLKFYNLLSPVVLNLYNFETQLNYKYILLPCDKKRDKNTIRAFFICLSWALLNFITSIFCFFCQLFYWFSFSSRLWQVLLVWSKKVKSLVKRLCLLFILCLLLLETIRTF